MRKLPKSTSSHDRFVYGQYPIRKLVRAGFVDLASNLTLANNALREAARLVEDLESPVQLAIADRDGVDDDLDETARLSRLRLAARSITAIRESPYIKIFPSGIAPYVSAKVGDQTLRYGEFIRRLEDFLAPNDPVRDQGIAKLTAQLAEWKAATQGVEAASQELALARTTRDVATAAWDSTIEKTHAALVSRLDKKKAERFFPRVKRKADPAPTPQPPLSGPEPGS